MKNLLVATAILGTLCLSACGGDSGSSAEDFSSSSGPTEAEFAARCNELFNIDETDPWSTSLDHNDYIAEHVCDQLTEYMSYKLSFYARCTSAEYDKAKNRYNIKIITEQKYMNIWAQLSGCSYKLGTDGDLAPMVADANERNLDDCLCKVEDGKNLYRSIVPKNQQESSSSTTEAQSSESSDDSPDSQDSHSTTPSGIIKTCEECNAFKDSRDGNIYRVTEIDGMVWMSEDLRYYDPELQLAYYIKCNKKDNCKETGYLYSFAAAMDDTDCMLWKSCGTKIKYPHRGVCPKGFHIPEHREWQKLYDYINVNRNNETYFNNEVYMRAVEGWDYPGYDTYGFSAVPTGEFNHDYTRMDGYARYWTSTEYDIQSAYEWYLGDLKGLKTQTYQKDYGYAIRCVADGTVKLTEVKEWKHSSGPSNSSESSSSSSLQGSSSSSEVPSSSSQEQSSSSKAYTYDHEITKATDCEDCNAFTDTRDGMTYRVAKIAGLIWMVDDLRFGGPLEQHQDGIKCPDNDNCVQRGRLYTFDAAILACPEGWTLPSNEQMEELMANSQWLNGICGSADALMAETGEWGKTCGNTSGFSAIPTGEWGSSYKGDAYARYWTSTDLDDRNAYMWYLSTSGAKNQTYLKSYGYAVRCVATANVLLDAVKE